MVDSVGLCFWLFLMTFDHTGRTLFQVNLASPLPDLYAEHRLELKFFMPLEIKSKDSNPEIKVKAICA